MSKNPWSAYHEEFEKDYPCLECCGHEVCTGVCMWKENQSTLPIEPSIPSEPPPVEPQEPIIDPSKFFIDERDGNKYPIVEINGVSWLGSSFIFDGGGKPYSNDPDNIAIYGRMYAWDEANNNAPPGWRLPTLQEWRDLWAFSGNDINKFKTAEGWATPGTNEFGLNLLPGGLENGQGTLFMGIGSQVQIWSSNGTHPTGTCWYAAFGDGGYSDGSVNRRNLRYVRYVKK